MAPKTRSFSHILRWVIAGSRGGVNRGKIIKILRETPVNSNQLAKLLDLDYRTIRHHIDILEKNGIITSIGERYGLMYFLSPEMENNYLEFEEIWKRFGTNKKSNEEGS